MEKILTPTHEISIDSHGIVHIKTREGAHIDVPMLEEINVQSQKLAGKKKVLAMVDATLFHTLTPEATAYLKRGIMDKTRVATAVVSAKVGVHIMVDFWNSTEKPKNPVRMFSSKEEAEKWLLTFKN